ncbi:hypothetical protein [Clostridium thermarum]|uniref:hypothetical protein n=1 Tax=Clostridium thermarum TaxID=1716543 RepID=UPI00111D9C70|nr:hypothetical protein [Clostridium thermarum]
MKAFDTLISETLEAENLEELEAAADLFQFGVEKGHYSKWQATEFNNAYWEVKNRCLALEISSVIKGNKLDIIDIVSKAPMEVKDDKEKLINYVNGRIKALKGKIKGLK